MKAIKTNLHFRYGRFGAGARLVQNMSMYIYLCLLSRCFVFNLINISFPIKDMSLFDVADLAVVTTKFAEKKCTNHFIWALGCGKLITQKLQLTAVNFTLIGHFFN